MSPPSSQATVLVVDDNAVNLKILVAALEQAGYEVVTATDGREAWELLLARRESFHAVLLDRLMPEMDGMEVLARLKAHRDLKALPVIMETAMARERDVVEGLQAGAYYYLTKPVNRKTLLAIVHSAVADYREHRALHEEVQQTTGTLLLMRSGRFVFRTLDEGRSLATFLASVCPLPGKAVIGLSELLINAVEHGNLGITYQEKSMLNEDGDWLAEVERRLARPEHASRVVTVEFERTEAELLFRIRDQGPGFDWQNFLDISPERAFDTHGRGIAMARITSFDRLEYREPGNEVLASILLPESRERRDGAELDERAKSESPSPVPAR